MSKTRKKEIDILKGIMIIFVVIGHISNNIPLMDVFWFHMPAFFIISGLLFSNRNMELTMAKFLHK